MKKLNNARFGALVALILFFTPTASASASTIGQHVVDLLSQSSISTSSIARSINYSINTKISRTENKNTVTAKGLNSFAYTVKTDQTNSIVEIEGNMTVSNSGLVAPLTIPVHIITQGLVTATSSPQVYVYIFPEYVTYVRTKLGSEQLSQYQNNWIKLSTSENIFSVPFDIVGNRKDVSANVWLNQNWFTAKSSGTGSLKTYTLNIKAPQFIANVRNIMATQGKTSNLSMLSEADLTKSLSNMKISLVENNKRLTGYNITSSSNTSDTSISGVKTTLSQDIAYSVNFLNVANKPQVPAQYSTVDLQTLLKSIESDAQTQARASISATDTQGGFTYAIPNGYTKTDVGKVPNAALQLVDFNDQDVYKDRINVSIWASDATTADILKIKNDADAKNIISQWYAGSDGHYLKNAYVQTVQGIPYVFKEETNTLNSMTLYLKTAYTVKNNLLYKIEFSDNSNQGAYQNSLNTFLAGVSIKDTIVNTSGTYLQFGNTSTTGNSMYPVQSTNTSQVLSTPSTKSTMPKDATALSYSVPSGYTVVYTSSNTVELRKDDTVKIPGGFGYDAIRIDLGEKAGVSESTAEFSMSNDAYAAEYRRQFPGTTDTNFQVKTLGTNMVIMSDSPMVMSGHTRYMRWGSFIRKNYSLDDVIYTFQITSDRPFDSNMSSLIDSFFQSVTVR